MSATINIMDYRMVDTLSSDQLEVDDLIGLNNEIVKIISITPMRYGYALTVENDFNEKDIVEILDDEQFELFVLE